MSNEPKQPKNENGNEVRKLFIGGLNWETTIDSFRQFFESTCQGQIVDVTMPLNHNTGNPRGFGFVGFTSKEDYDMILEMSKNKTLVIMGKNVEAKTASNNPPPRKQNYYRPRQQNYGGGYDQFAPRMQRRPMYGNIPQNYYGYQMPPRPTRGEYPPAQGGYPPQGAYGSNMYAQPTTGYPQPSSQAPHAYPSQVPPSAHSSSYNGAQTSHPGSQTTYSGQPIPSGLQASTQSGYPASNAPSQASYSAVPNGGYGPTSAAAPASTKYNPF